MASFTQRTTAPTEADAWFYANNPFYQSGYGLPNCTCYAWGRFAELLGSKPNLSLSDAENWYSHADGYERGQTPKVGAVICWRKGSAGVNADGAGHVGIVEAVNADGSIVTSESGWNDSRFWWTRTRTNDGNWSAGSAYTFQGFIYHPLNFGGSSGIDTTTNEGYIWDYFMGKIGNAYGVAGLMGNLYYESMLYPDIVQGDLPYSDYSKNYTTQVDSGAISENDFVYNGPGGGGYGLAQWTYYTRKQELYNMYKSGGYSSIGSIELACDFLWHELKKYFTDVLDVLKNAKSVRVASDKVLHDFESPADQSTAVEVKRATQGQYYYDKYAQEGSGGPGGKKRRLSLLLMYIATRRRV